MYWLRIFLLVPLFSVIAPLIADYDQDQMIRNQQMADYRRSLYYRSGAGPSTYYQYGYPAGGYNTAYPAAPGTYPYGGIVPYPYTNPYSNPQGFDYDTDAIYHRNLNK